MKYHMGQDGQYRRCSAKVRPCPLGLTEDEHVDMSTQKANQLNREAAEAAAARDDAARAYLGVQKEQAASARQDTAQTAAASENYEVLMDLAIGGDNRAHYAMLRRDDLHPDVLRAIAQNTRVSSVASLARRKLDEAEARLGLGDRDGLSVTDDEGADQLAADALSKAREEHNGRYLPPETIQALGNRASKYLPGMTGMEKIYLAAHTEDKEALKRMVRELDGEDGPGGEHLSLAKALYVNPYVTREDFDQLLLRKYPVLRRRAAIEQGIKEHPGAYASLLTPLQPLSRTQRAYEVNKDAQRKLGIADEDLPMVLRDIRRDYLHDIRYDSQNGVITGYIN